MMKTVGQAWGKHIKAIATHLDAAQIKVLPSFFKSGKRKNATYSKNGRALAQPFFLLLSDIDGAEVLAGDIRAFHGGKP